MSRKPDLRGISSITLDADGDFDEVKVLGGLFSSKSLNANYVDVKGSVDLTGSLWANNVEVLGGVNVGADLIAELDISIKGGVKTGGKLQGRHIQIQGGVSTREDIVASTLGVLGGIKAVGHIKIEDLLDVKGGLVSFKGIAAGEIQSIGGISTEQNVKATRIIDVRGKIEIGGNVDCDEFICKVSEPSFIEGKLTANRIRIEKDENAKSECFLRIAEIVSPNRVDIDYVIVDRIVAPKVKAGQNCRINEEIDKDYKP
jgi:hypothetical protein